MLQIRMPSSGTIETIRVGDLAVLHAAPADPTHGPVLFVHGYFADASVFSEWLPLFAANGFPAYAVHLRGRSGSRMSIDLGGASMDDFVADSAEVAKTLGNPLVVGHSMGGLITQRLCELGLARAAVLVSPAPPRGITVLSPRLVLKQLKYLPSILRSRPVEPQRDDLREMVLNHVPVEQQDFVLGHLMPDSGRAGREMSITGVRVHAANVRCPLLILAGSDDRFIPLSIARRIAARYHAPIRIFEGHGHMLVLEPGWQAIAEAALRFAESHDDRTGH